MPSLHRTRSVDDVDLQTPETADPAAAATRCSGAALDRARNRLEQLAALDWSRVPAVAEYGADTMAAFDIGVRPAVRRALERLDDRTYGSCDRCPARISTARLAAIPYARRCERCQREAEHHWHGLDAMIAERVRNLVGEPQGPAWAP